MKSPAPAQRRQLLFTACCTPSSIPTEKLYFEEDVQLAGATSGSTSTAASSTAASTPSVLSPRTPGGGSVTSRLFRLLVEAEAESNRLVAAAREKQSELQRQAEVEADEALALYRDHFAAEFEHVERSHADSAQAFSALAEKGLAQELTTVEITARSHVEATQDFLIECVYRIDLELAPQAVQNLLARSKGRRKQ